MKYVVIPNHVIVCERKTGEPVLLQLSETDKTKVPWIITHEEFVLDQVCSHPSVAKGGGNGIRRQIKMQALFSKCREGNVIPVEDADYAILRAAIDQLEWAPAFTRYASQMLPHIQAWEDAEKQDDAWKKRRDASQGEVVPRQAS